MRSKVYLPDEDLDTMRRQRGFLAESLHDILVATNIIREDSQPNGAELLMFADELIEHHRRFGGVGSDPCKVMGLGKELGIIPGEKMNRKTEFDTLIIMPIPERLYGLVRGLHVHDAYAILETVWWTLYSYLEGGCPGDTKDLDIRLSGDFFEQYYNAQMDGLDSNSVEDNQESTRLETMIEKFIGRSVELKLWGSLVDFFSEQMDLRKKITDENLSIEVTVNVRRQIYRIHIFESL